MNRDASIEMARKYGAIPLTQTDGSYTVSLLEQTPYGPDVVLEVVGNPSAHALAIDLVRIGGVVASCGVHSAALTINGDTAYNKNLKFCFGRCHVRAMFPYALGLLQKIGKETPELLDDFVQKVVSIDEGPEVSLRGCRGSIRVDRG
jgi:threonine dehydrogenase-like Zn-dependent dehydrogenase